MKYVSENGLIWGTEAEAQEEDRLYFTMEKGREQLRRNICDLIHEFESQFRHVKVSHVSYGGYLSHVHVDVNVADKREHNAEITKA